MKKFYKPLLILSLFSVLIISGTTAYFTSSSESDENIFASGNLKIEVEQDDVLSVQDWFPGSEHTMEFSMLNTGSMPEYVKGYLGGSWDQGELNSSVFRISKMERKINDTWIAINNEGLDINDEFYFSSDGTENTLLELLAGAEENFRLTIILDDETSDEYQNQVFTASLHLASKQIEIGSMWPENY